MHSLSSRDKYCILLAPGINIAYSLAPGINIALLYSVNAEMAPLFSVTMYGKCEHSHTEGHRVVPVVIESGDKIELHGLP